MPTLTTAVPDVTKDLLGTKPKGDLEVTRNNTAIAK
jgi:hypothetical protein